MRCDIALRRGLNKPEEMALADLPAPDPILAAARCDEPDVRGRRITIIHNPIAGRRNAGQVQAILDWLQRLDVDVDCRRTEGPGHAERLALEAALDGATIVAAAGGDGTVHEVVNGLALAPQSPQSTALAVLPIGTANVLAAELGIRPEPSKLARMLAAGGIRTVDLGRANDRWFIGFAGIGADACAVDRVSPVLKRVLGQGSYALAALSALVMEPARAFEVVTDGVPLRASAVLATNIRAYAGPGLAVPEASMEDGLLDVLLAQGQGLPAWTAFGLRLYFGSRLPIPGIGQRRGRTLRISGPPGMPVQLDGDVRLRTPVEISIVPNRLPLVVPTLVPSQARTSSRRAISGGIPNRTGRPVEPTPALT